MSDRKMKAAVIDAVGAPPVYRDVDEPVRRPGETLIEVSAAPVNPIDLATAAGRLPTGAPNTPYVAGREGVGRVLESNSLAPGTRVYASGAGFMAQRAVAGDESVIPVPDGIGDALASCFGISGLAAWLALQWRAKLREGETVLVLGASGAVGAVAVQAAKLLGAARVVAAARSDAGLDRAVQLGADATVNLDGEIDLAAAISAATDGELLLTIDPLWGKPAEAALRATAFGGRLVQLGQSAGAEATFASGIVQGRMLTILGHTNLAVAADVRRAAYLTMIEHASAGDLTADHELVALERVAEAWERQRSSPNLKLVLSPGS